MRTLKNVQHCGKRLDQQKRYLDLTNNFLYLDCRSNATS